ncbi:hypothetical protein QE152_g13407 [Popillia japonica]|uniref:Uncharacterized protein n=1 Tax=Popillia japonica TaxID=7064 RepID=A0AAW1LBW7_POPJA
MKWKTYFPFCKLPVRFFCFELDTTGVIISWIGAIYRLVAVIIASLLLSMTEYYHPNIYLIAYPIAIAISAMNLIGNIMFLYGIYRKRHLFMLPYLSTGVFEILILVVVILFFNVLYAFRHPFTLTWLVPLSVLIFSGNPLLQRAIRVQAPIYADMVGPIIGANIYRIRLRLFMPD